MASCAPKTRKPQKQDLTLKQEKACRKFMETGEMSTAYRHAYSTKNMKPSTVHRRAFDLFELGKIKARLKILRGKAAERNNISVDRVLKEYAKLAFLDPRKFYDKDGDLISVHRLPADVAATITGMDVQTVFTKDGDMAGDLKKIKFADKKAALDSVAKHLGMFIERHEHTGKDGKELFPTLSAEDKALLQNISKREQK